MPKPQSQSQPPKAGKAKDGETVIRLIRELAIRPPAKDVASLKAATEVFEANAGTPTDGDESRVPSPTKDDG